jgi:hypothetical protein
MTGWIRSWWPIIAGCAAVLVYLITGSIQIGEMKNESKHKHESAATERRGLEAEDKRIHKRIDKTDKRLTKVKSKSQAMGDTVLRIEVNQATIIKNQERLLQKLER